MQYSLERLVIFFNAGLKLITSSLLNFLIAVVTVSCPMETETKLTTLILVAKEQIKKIFEIRVG